MNCRYKPRYCHILINVNLFDILKLYLLELVLRQCDVIVTNPCLNDLKQFVSLYLQLRIREVLNQKLMSYSDLTRSRRENGDVKYIQIYRMLSHT
jgi:hypothetical protein